MIFFSKYLLIVALFFISLSCQIKNQNDFTYIGIKEKLLSECDSAFSKDYSFTIKQIHKSQFRSMPEIKHLINKGLEEVVVLNFTSYKDVQKNTKLSFLIFLCEYESSRRAKSIFSNLEKVKSSQDETIFSKDWDYLSLDKNIILRMDATCLYSKESWQKLKDNFIMIKMKIMPNGSNANIIECFCGGSCK